MNDITCKRVKTAKELTDAFVVRREVFVREQNISEDEEYDGQDDSCYQYIAQNSSTVVGTARAHFVTPGCIKIERMAVLHDYRRQGIGTSILNYIEGEFKQGNVTQLTLHSQMSAVPFYKACGFQEIGTPFYEAGIEHIKMQKSLFTTV